MIDNFKKTQCCLKDEVAGLLIYCIINELNELA